jgi:hypothetical protein
MRHRSPRPVLDRLLKHPAPGMVRRGALVAGAVTGTAALGITFAGPLVGGGTPGRAAAIDSPVSSASASWLILTPPSDREPRATRGGERSAPPAPRVERDPGPTASTRQAPESPPESPSEASPTAGDTPSRSSSPTATRTPSPTRAGSGDPDDTAPETSASTTTVEDGVWTVSSTADEAGTFECSLDGGEYDECDPTASFDDLENGKHTLDVRAVDEDGNVDPTPIRLVTNITGNLLD